MKTTTTLWLCVLGMLSACASVSPVERAAQQEEQNRQRARLLTEELYNLRKLDRVPELFAEDYVDHSQGAPKDVVGPAVVLQQAEATFQTFPDLRFDILHVVADQDLVLVHWKAAGTDPLNLDDAGKPRPLALAGHSLYRMRDGKVVESWDISDRLTPLLQRGYRVVPPQP
ncbi:ester cyclase [Myxococcus sp. MISCRS1]|jgi:predicted SnoaL-like aldol condensation-catalyzing enzyme|uniref:ester cyclase n=1 Tax=Myxococcus TaxID=32 RepID=UPI001CBC84BB|nr:MULTISPECIES: ester cyclase [unclassified Myxococcus]MBZ4396050.1 ester cyclase [Myxococcus sp. AS-1-15]MBZ4408839.1 ester cyclase [Myxococcus sp. XM-1-1-1]MCY1000901.1 ester cyclase [Myxococcus sp. MISCRS1]BDT37543.1 ester cyclase [Myxococcus sp. MH1]